MIEINCQLHYIHIKIFYIPLYFSLESSRGKGRISICIKNKKQEQIDVF